MMTLILLRAPAALLIAWASFAETFSFRDLGPERVPPPSCEASLARPAPTVRLGLEDKVYVTTWNVEGVDQSLGRFENTGVGPSGRYQHAPRVDQNRDLAPWKFNAKQTKIARAAELAGARPGTLPHFVIAPEVEFGTENHLFGTGPLAGKYRTVITRGNDTRPIDIAFAVRADLDVKIEIESHRHAKWFDSIEGAEARVFTRDLPALIVRDGPTDDVLMILIGQHAKSMRDRAGGRDAQSRVLRAAQFAATARIIDLYRRRYRAEVPILMAGDFNAEVRTAPEVGPLRARLTDAFDHLGVSERTTHTYHPHEQTVIRSQLDAVMVSDSVKPFLLSALVLPEFDRITGLPLGSPASLADRTSRFPSDHRAITIVLDGKLFPARKGPEH